jgi:hypothetical protein
MSQAMLRSSQSFRFYRRALPEELGTTALLARGLLRFHQKTYLLCWKSLGTNSQHEEQPLPRSNLMKGACNQSPYIRTRRCAGAEDS